VKKTRMVKNFEDLCNRLDRISACVGQTGIHTDIFPRHSPRYAYASRDKNGSGFGGELNCLAPPHDSGTELTAAEEKQ